MELSRDTQGGSPWKDDWGKEKGERNKRNLWGRVKTYHWILKKTKESNSIRHEKKKNGIRVTWKRVAKVTLI